MKKNVEKKTENTVFNGKLERLEKKLISLIAAATLSLTPVVVSAEGNAAAPAASGGGADASAAMKDVMAKVGEWVGKGALGVCLVGAIMFGFAIKNNDAEAKQNGLLTMCAGGIVAAICGMLSKFGF